MIDKIDALEVLDVAAGRVVNLHQGRGVIMSRVIKHFLLFLAVFVGAALITGCEKERTWKIGAPAPEISVLDGDDKTVKLSAYKGKVVMLMYWESGCQACIAGMPALEAFHSRYKDRGLAVLAVNMGNSRELVAAFAKGLHISYPVLRDPELIAAKKYGVRAVPTTYFIDRNGVARKAVAGEINQDLFDKAVKDLL
jgi:cytochrome c biogenesis protein CcmG/thiol:disulfide interchange protein DsbE